MQVSDKKRFAEAMLFLRDHYPSFKPTEADWKRHLRVYFERLSDLSWAALYGAVHKASQPEYYPDFFPTEGQLRRIAEDVERDVKRNDAHRADETAKLSSPLAPLEYYSDVPADEAEQREWIESAPTPFDRLARAWKAESRNLWLDPNRPTPRDVFERRMAELWATWGRAAGEPEQEAA